MATKHGFTIFYPNYHTNTKHNIKFSKLDHLNPNNKEFDNVIDNIDTLTTQNLINKNKMKIINNSYKNYTTT